jgi:hypothetical protein
MLGCCAGRVGLIAGGAAFTAGCGCAMGLLTGETCIGGWNARLA